MPRIARKDLSASFFHVIVQGVNKEYIFDKEHYIKKYLSLIDEYKKTYNIEVLAYCIMNNHAHLLLKIQDYKQMSCFMHKINCIYAQFYNYKENRVGVVFRNRYVSEAISDIKHLKSCIKYIHMNPVKAKIVTSCSQYKYSTYNDYIMGKGVTENKFLEDIFGKQDYSKIFSEADDNMVFYDIERNNYELIENILEIYMNQNKMSLNEIIANKRILKEIINILKSKYKVSYVDIRKKLGISRGKFEYFISKS